MSIYVARLFMKTMIGENSISNFGLSWNKSECDNKKSTETYFTKIFLPWCNWFIVKINLSHSF